MENINLDLFHPKKAELTEVAEKYKDLKINGIEDKEGFKLVHSAQMELKGLRVNIQKTRKDYTRQFDEAKKQAIDLEKELLEIISPIEDSLKEQKQAVEEEKEKIRQEELEKKRKFLQDRVDSLAAVGYSHSDLHALSQMTEEDFQILFSDQKIEFDKKQKELEEEKTIKEKNEIRSKILNAHTLYTISEIEDYIENIGFDLEEFKSDLDAKKAMIEQQAKIYSDQKKIDEENQRIADEKKKIQDEKDEKKRLEDLEVEKEKARKEGEEKAKKDAEVKRLQEKQAAEVKEKELAKKKKYQSFLEKNGITQEKIDSGEIIRKTDDVQKTVSFYQKIDVFSF